MGIYNQKSSDYLLFSNPPVNSCISAAIGVKTSDSDRKLDGNWFIHNQTLSANKPEVRISMALFGFSPALNEYEFKLYIDMGDRGFQMFQNARFTKWLSIKELITSGDVVVRKNGITAEQAYYNALAIVPSSSSLRLEYTIDPQGGLFLEIRGLDIEAVTANSDQRLNGNNVDSIFLKKIKVDTIPPQEGLNNENYPFGLVIFSHKGLTLKSYKTLAQKAMEQILPYFNLQAYRQPPTGPNEVLVGSQPNDNQPQSSSYNTQNSYYPPPSQGSSNLSGNRIKLNFI